MPWPIDDSRAADPLQAVSGVPLQRPVRERLLLERSIARRWGFACFADYFENRRSQGFGLNRLARETGQSRDWVRGVIRRYEARPAEVRPAS